MKAYWFVLLSSAGVASDFGVQHLPDPASAHARAEALADHLRQSRPDYVAKQLKVAVRDDDGTLIVTHALAT